MTVDEVLADAFGRVRENVHGAVAGLSEDQLAYRIDPEANSIAWLIWHLTRVQDDHVADAFGGSQVWPSWSSRFGLPFGDEETGYAHDPDTAGAVRAAGSLLTGYYDEVHAQTLGFLSGLAGTDLDRIVDERWDPPVSLGVRLVSVIDDCAQHSGQAAFIRGVVLRAAG